MAELLETGLILMAAGMGTVFLLLALLVFVIQAVSKLSRVVDPHAPAVAPEDRPPVAPADDTELVTVIGAAVSAYRRNSNTPG
jgi:oxaloacetate decarboxylase gamma subunit